MIRAFGVEMAGHPMALPATFVLAPGDGKILYRRIGENAADRPTSKEVVAAARNAGPSQGEKPSKARRPAAGR